MTNIETFYALRNYLDLVDATCREIREAEENDASEEVINALHSVVDKTYKNILDHMDTGEEPKKRGRPRKV